MSVSREANVAGVYEHPAREAPDTSTAELHAEVVATFDRTRDDLGIPRFRPA